MLKTARIFGALTLALGLGVGCAGKDDDNDRPARDNTGVNARDRKDTETTAQHAGMGKSDVEIMAGIRKRVVADGALGTNAHNVKIVANNGTVTLKGPVASAIEKATVEDYAAEVVGRDNIVNELEIAP